MNFSLNVFIRILWDCSKSQTNSFSLSSNTTRLSSSFFNSLYKPVILSNIFTLSLTCFTSPDTCFQSFPLNFLFHLHFHLYKYFSKALNLLSSDSANLLPNSLNNYGNNSFFFFLLIVLTILPSPPFLLLFWLSLFLIQKENYLEQGRGKKASFPLLFLFQASFSLIFSSLMTLHSYSEPHNPYPHSYSQYLSLTHIIFNFCFVKSANGLLPLIINKNISKKTWLIKLIN